MNRNCFLLSLLLMPFFFSATQEKTASQKIMPGGYRIFAELKNGLSSGTAVVGQTVELKVLDDVASQNGTVYIPRNAKLIGKVTHVLRSRPEQPTGEISFHIERAEWKDGELSLNAYPVTLGMPLTSTVHEYPDLPDKYDLHPLTGAPTNRAQANRIQEQMKRASVDPSYTPPYTPGMPGVAPTPEGVAATSQRTMTIKSGPIPEDWGIIRVDDPAVWSMIGSNQRDISLPKSMRFVLRQLPLNSH